MPKFNVTITETLVKTVEVEAANSIDAIDEAKRMHHEDDIVLGANNIVSIGFSATNPMVE